LAKGHCRRAFQADIEPQGTHRDTNRGAQLGGHKPGNYCTNSRQEQILTGDYVAAQDDEFWTQDLDQLGQCDTQTARCAIHHF
jgi:hypothetical protein